MEYTTILEQMEQAKRACFQYVRQGNTRYRDVLSLSRNNTCYFERYCYGEAAGLVFKAEGTITNAAPMQLQWALEDELYSNKNDVPVCLTGMDDGTLFFDTKHEKWAFEKSFKKCKKSRVNWIKKVLKCL